MTDNLEDTGVVSDPYCYVDALDFNDGTHMDVSQSDIVVFVGPNNAGKSRSLKDIYELFCSATMILSLSRKSACIEVLPTMSSIGLLNVLICIKIRGMNSIEDLVIVCIKIIFPCGLIQRKAFMIFSRFSAIISARWIG